MSHIRHSPLACVIGDMDLVRPLGLAGIPCAVVAPAGAPQRYSRFRHAVLDWIDAWERPEEVLKKLLCFGSAQCQRPVLFYEEDGDLLLISRFRDRLGQVFRFVIPDARLVEDLVDKARFQALATRLALPVPAGHCMHPVQGSMPSNLELRFPVIIKPLTRRPSLWRPIGGAGKALQVDSTRKLRDLWPRLIAANMGVVVQELIPGPEMAIESYHVYVDEAGTIVGEFTGKKIRTYPGKFGDSTALMITSAQDVAELGRGLVQRLKLCGVAKFDFKRGTDGKLYLLEINPRFTLWHHPGAIAGVNLPALVYGDLIGRPRPLVPQARAGVRWCRVWQDVKAARSHGIPLFKWLPWALSCEAKSGMAWDDPLPLLGAAMKRVLCKLRHGMFRKRRKRFLPAVDSEKYSTKSGSALALDQHSG